MAEAARSVRARALAKINLGLKVLNKRPDGYHELRTIFQTISLADELAISYTPGRRTEIVLDCEPQIPDNLVIRAAERVMAEMRRTGLVRMKLTKKIPMGGGLGGGSSDAAAVLLALPVLAGRAIAMDRLAAMGAELGSDVTFFLYGGTALGLGRGTELYPLADVAAAPGILVTPGLHVSTAVAFGALGRGLTLQDESPILIGLQALAWSASGGAVAAEWLGCENDFEPVVFRQHPQLKSIQAKLIQLGAKPARMTGSGSALFGLFATTLQRDAALSELAAAGLRAWAIKPVGQKQYRNLWWKALEHHMDTKTWPPQSRYAR